MWNCNLYITSRFHWLVSDFYISSWGTGLDCGSYISSLCHGMYCDSYNYSWCTVMVVIFKIPLGALGVYDYHDVLGGAVILTFHLSALCWS